MTRSLWRGVLFGVLWTMGLAVTVAWAQPAQAKLERLRIAIAASGWDTNFTWRTARSGLPDKRPALEFLVGIHRSTGAYIPELAETWAMAPDGQELDAHPAPGDQVPRPVGGVYGQGCASLRCFSLPSLSPCRALPATGVPSWG